MTKTTPLILTIFLLLLASGLNCQAQAEDAETLETIVVTAAGYEQEITDAPASISVITAEELNRRAYKDLTDALEDVPGIMAKSGGSKKDISIRGMPVQYTAILVNGKKQSGRESQPSGSGAFEQDWLPPLEAIERIEIVRGPMSTLYGSDAIGGVINIITRTDYQTWTGNLRTETIQQDSSESGDHYQNQIYAAGPLIKDVLSISLSGIYQRRVEDEIMRGYGEKNLRNYQGTFYFTPKDDHTFTLDLNKQDQTRATTSGKSNTRTSETENKRTSVSLIHDGQYGHITSKTYAQSERVKNIGRSITIENRTLNTLWTLPVGMHFMSIGAEYEKENLKDTTTNSGDETTIENSQIALYTEDEWAITDNVRLTFGARVDDNEQFNTHISPRVYAVWKLNEAWTVKGGVSTGYRAPELREMSADWVQESRGGDIYGNPDLDPEISLNKEIGIHYSGKNSVNAGLTLFHSDFEDKITTVDCPTSICGDPTGRYNVNIDEAITYGVEASFAMDLTETVNFSANYTYTYSEQESGDYEGQPLTQLPEHLFTADIEWQALKNVNLWSRVNYRGEESDSSAASSRAIIAPAYTTVDVGGSWMPTDYLKIKLGIYNLADKEIRYDEFGYVEDGKRYWLALDMSF